MALVLFCCAKYGRTHTRNARILARLWNAQEFAAAQKRKKFPILIFLAENGLTNKKIFAIMLTLLCEKRSKSRRSAAGSAQRSGLNHRSRRIIFEKSRKPLKTLTFSALPNVEKSSNLRSDHMFDHLQKNTVLHQSGCGSAW